MFNFFRFITEVVSNDILLELSMPQLVLVCITKLKNEKSSKQFVHLETMKLLRLFTNYLKSNRFSLSYFALVMKSLFLVRECLPVSWKSIVTNLVCSVTFRLHFYSKGLSKAEEGQSYSLIGNRNEKLETLSFLCVGFLLEVIFILYKNPFKQYTNLISRLLRTPTGY